MGVSTASVITFVANSLLSSVSIPKKAPMTFEDFWQKQLQSDEQKIVSLLRPDIRDLRIFHKASSNLLNHLRYIITYGDDPVTRSNAKTPPMDERNEISANERKNLLLYIFQTTSEPHKHADGSIWSAPALIVTTCFCWEQTAPCSMPGRNWPGLAEGATCSVSQASSAPDKAH